MKQLLTTFTLLCFIFIAGCSVPGSSDLEQDIEPTYQEPQQLIEIIDGFEIKRTKSFTEDNIIYTNQLSGYQSGDVVVLMIEPSGYGPEAIIFKNATAYTDLIFRLQNGNCRLSYDNSFVQSVPNEQYQQQINKVMEKVDISSQSSLNEQENLIYGTIQNPCPYSEGIFKVHGSIVIWYRNPKNGGGISSYISDIKI